MREESAVYWWSHLGMTNTMIARFFSTPPPPKLTSSRTQKSKMSCPVPATVVSTLPRLGPEKRGSTYHQTSGNVRESLCQATSRSAPHCLQFFSVQMFGVLGIPSRSSAKPASVTLVFIKPISVRPVNCLK